MSVVEEAVAVAVVASKKPFTAKDAVKTIKEVQYGQRLGNRGSDSVVLGFKFKIF